MTLKHLRIFQEIYQTGNVTKAAENLYMSQPAVSRALREIEEYYNVKLFERFHHRLTATDAGRSLYERSVQILVTMDELEKSMKDGDAAGILRIGCSITIGNFLMPGLASEFAADHAKIRLQVTVGNEQTLERMLQDNSLDLALIENIVTQDDLHTEPFMQDRLVPVVSCGHEILNRKKIRLADITEYPLLLREKGSAARAYIDSVFQARGTEAVPLWESTSTQALIRAASAGIGIAIVPALLVQDDIDHGRVAPVRLTDERLIRKYYIVYHKDKYLTPVLKQTIRRIRQTGG